MEQDKRSRAYRAAAHITREQLMRDDPNIESHWTNFNQPLGRKLFKGAASS